MINLLPPDFKQDLEFARRNAVATRYLLIIATTGVIISGAFYGSHLYLNAKLAETADSIAAKEQSTTSYREVEANAKTLNSRVAAIKAIQDSQPKFSALLGDIAKAVPKDAAITQLTLNGDDTKPVKISATASSYATAVALRDALAASPRIAGADIDSISGNTIDGYSVDITIGFKPGQAK